jgi:cytochrome c biogenesis protein CcdA
LLFLAAFSIGSALAMAVFTSAIAKLGTRLSSRFIERTQNMLAIAAGALGVYWIL